MHTLYNFLKPDELLQEIVARPAKFDLSNNCGSVSTFHILSMNSTNKTNSAKKTVKGFIKNILI